MKYKQLTTRNQCMRCYHILHVTLGVPVSPLATFTHYFEASQPLSNSHSIEQAHPSMDNITPPEPSYILYHIILYHFAYSRTVPVRFVSLRFVSIPKPSPSPPSPHFTQLHTTCKRHATKPNARCAAFFSSSIKHENRRVVSVGCANAGLMQVLPWFRWLAGVVARGDAARGWKTYWR
jgi:hypothetical protein